MFPCTFPISLSTYGRNMDPKCRTVRAEVDIDNYQYVRERRFAWTFRPVRRKAVAPSGGRTSRRGHPSASRYEYEYRTVLVVSYSYSYVYGTYKGLVATRPDSSSSFPQLIISAGSCHRTWLAGSVMAGTSVFVQTHFGFVSGCLQANSVACIQNSS